MSPAMPLEQATPCMPSATLGWPKRSLPYRLGSISYRFYSPYTIHVAKIIIGHLNSGSNKTVFLFTQLHCALCFPLIQISGRGKPSAYSENQQHDKCSLFFRKATGPRRSMETHRLLRRTVYSVFGSSGLLCIQRHLS